MKYLYKYKSIFLSLLLTGGVAAAIAKTVDRPHGSAPAEEVTKAEHNPLFEINRSNIIEDESLYKLGRFADSLQREGKLMHFEICGFSSPDGPEVFNAKLATDRARAIQAFFLNKYGIPASTFEITSVAEDWDKTRQLVANSSFNGKDAVLSIIDNTPNADVREKKLRALPSSWRVLARDVFPRVRRAEMVIHYTVGELHATLSDEGTKIETPVPEPEPEPEIIPEPVDTVPAQAPAPEWQRHAYVKTNIPAWFLLWINAAGEIDLAPHWSVNLSLYYSGFDYFQHRRKYRTFAVMSEIRWWPSKNNQGFFLAPHFGLAYYNVAFEGQYRYQDHDGTTPALGGGINLGCRFNVSRNKRWKMEFSVGFGIYHLDYDLFINERNGFLADRRHRTFYGIDNAALSICYMFDVKKKGGKK